MLERARAWWRRERHAIPEPRPRPVQRREHGPVLPAVAAFVDRAEAAVPPGRWRALLLGPVVGLLWFATSYQALRGVPDGAVDPVALVTGLATVPLLARRRAPLWSWLVIAVGVAILSGAHPVLPAGAVISLLVALYTIGVRCGRVISTGAGVLSGLALLPMVGNEFRSGVPLPLPLTLSLVVAVLALADQVGTRRLTEQALADAAEASRREQARRAVLEERSRIARELHDVVAHHMSMVAVQAETAPYRLSGLPEEGVRDFAAIGETAREALNEMRRLLGVLRSDAEPAERAPQPGLGHLGELVDGARGAGLPATNDRDRGAAPAPGGRGAVGLPDRAGGAQQRRQARGRGRHRRGGGRLRARPAPGQRDRRRTGTGPAARAGRARPARDVGAGGHARGQLRGRAGPGRRVPGRGDAADTGGTGMSETQAGA
jgi:hypothetical protein